MPGTLEVPTPNAPRTTSYITWLFGHCSRVPHDPDECSPSGTSSLYNAYRFLLIRESAEQLAEADDNEHVRPDPELRNSMRVLEGDDLRTQRARLERHDISRLRLTDSHPRLSVSRSPTQVGILSIAT